MMKLWIPVLALSITTLTACAPFRPSDHRAAYCNELNSKIIFNGNTSNDRNQEIEHAQEPLMIHNYDKHCQKG
jgi:hypothetical protein